MTKYFFHDIKGQGGEITKKGITVKETYEAALQAYHSYLGAYAYGNEPNTDFVSCFITDGWGNVLLQETWTAPEPEPNAE